MKNFKPIGSEKNLYRVHVNQYEIDITNVIINFTWN